MHAMTGCDTTSAMFGVGKTFGGGADVWYLTTRKYILFKVGEKFIVALYGGSEGRLNVLRCRQFTSPKYVPLERMPPTRRACYYH